MSTAMKMRSLYCQAAQKALQILSSISAAILRLAMRAASRQTLNQKSLWPSIVYVSQSKPNLRLRQNTCASWTSSNKAGRCYALPSIHADTISIIVPRALLIVDEYRQLVQEDARRKLEWEQSRSLPIIKEYEDKGYTEMHRRLSQFEAQLRCGNDKTHRLIRNKHVLLTTMVDLPASDAPDAVAKDPGLRLVNSPEKGVTSFVRWDAGCSSCGGTFELGSSGKPMREADALDDQLTLFDVEESPLWDILKDEAGISMPQGSVPCPSCGRVSKLSLDASEIIVAFNWPIIAIAPCRVPFNRAGNALELSRRIIPEHLGMYFNLAKGWAWHGLADASKRGLRPDVAQRLDEYPIAEAVARLLSKNGVEIERVQLGCSMSINELIEAIGDA